jgi:hypothetical protein
MSPQMNGEPRESTSTTANQGTPVRPPQATMGQGDQPLLEAINTAGVSQTTVVVNEDVALAPLFTQDAAMDFRSRWDVVQKSFVDNPQEAVRAGDDVVAQVIKSLTETFSNQRSQLESELNQTDQASTENLRLAFRRYRSFFERLLSI